MQQYRIIQYPTRVHVQQQRSFLGLKWWAYLLECYGSFDSFPAPINYKTIEAAKLAIDHLLAGSSPAVIIAYPTPTA